MPARGATTSQPSSRPACKDCWCKSDKETHHQSIFMSQQVHNPLCTNIVPQLGWTECKHVDFAVLREWQVRGANGAVRSVLDVGNALRHRQIGHMKRARSRNSGLNCQQSGVEHTSTAVAFHLCCWLAKRSTHQAVADHWLSAPRTFQCKWCHRPPVCVSCLS